MKRFAGATRVVAVGIAIVLVTGQLPAHAGQPLGGAGSTTLAREPQLTPSEIGNGRLDGLQFGDATEGLTLVDPPAVSNDGGAHLSYPLVIPKGRGIAPQLALSYDSGADNGWVGQGWDLSVGEIAVDTRWGAPY